MNNLQKIRKERGLSLAALADMIGTSAPQLNRLEKGDRRMSDVWLDKLAPALNTTRAEILGEIPSVSTAGTGVKVDLLKEILETALDYKASLFKANNKKISHENLAKAIASIYAEAAKGQLEPEAIKQQTCMLLKFASQ